ncbi:hypothetical protein DF268_00155 [Streptomyces sp. V2]|nr:hypothetical protein DF268_00155 [Streptomyces sp. V2]
MRLYAEEPLLLVSGRFGRGYTDDRPWSACAVRPEPMREQIGSGCADFSKFTEQLAWFGVRLAFVAVVEGGRR